MSEKKMTIVGGTAIELIKSMRNAIKVKDRKINELEGLLIAALQYVRMAPEDPLHEGRSQADKLQRLITEALEEKK